MSGEANPVRTLDEFEVRQYFMTADLTEALTTHAICEGILSARQQQPAKRKRRDSGVKRKKDDQQLSIAPPDLDRIITGARADRESE